MKPTGPIPAEGLTLVVAPASDHAGGLDLEGLVGFLSSRAAIPIRLVRCRDYGEAITALRDGSAQLGWLGAFAYQEAASDGDIEAFAIGVPKGKATPNYQSLLIARADGPVKTLADVKNKRIAIGDVHSTSGYMVPKRQLGDIGINLENVNEFREIVRVHTHDEAIRLVAEGRVDAAPVSSVNFDENLAKGTIDADAVRVVHRSQDIPGAPLVYLASLPADLKKTLKDLALEAHRYIDVGGYGGALERYLDPSEGRRKLLEGYLRPQWGWRARLSLAGLVAVTAAIMVDLEVDPLALIRSASSYLVDVIGRMLPPDFSNFTDLLLSMLETIEIAALGTLLAIVLSIPIGLLSARNIAPNYAVYAVARTITIFFRAIPEFIMAMVLVIAIGFGAMPGVIALGLHTMGFLAKFYAEAIEHVKVGPLEALGSLGASRTQVLAFAVAPQIMASFVGNNLYILDRNIRMATMLGIVGAGGIGYELQSSFRMFEYQRVSAIIIVIFAAIFAIDMISSRIRAKVQ